MLAVFQTSPIPFWGMRNGNGVHFGHALTGETYEELAWDLVEMYFDNPFSRTDFGGGAPAGMVLVVDADAIEPNLTQTLDYHARRFSDEWWDFQRVRLLGFFGQGFATEMSSGTFRRLFPAETLLAVYLQVLIGRTFARYHGMPESVLDARGAIEYLAEHHYLHWLDEANPHSLRELVEGRKA